MPESTFEEAKRCPRCKKPGNDRHQSLVRGAREKGLDPGTAVHYIYCENPVCPWYETNWIIQVNPDGSVPPPTMHHEKQYPTRVPKGMTVEQVAEKARRGINKGTE